MDTQAIWNVVLQALPLLLGPLAVWGATALVAKLKPTLTGKTLIALVVPFFSFIATIIATFIGTTVNPILLFALNTCATFVHEFLKEWQKDAALKELAKAQPK